jgi:hypothetical protein
VTNGYPSASACNTPAVAAGDLVACEVDNLSSLAKLHSIVPGLPPDQITWWCQTVKGSALHLDCTLSASNPCDQMHAYPGLILYNTQNAIMTALSSGLVPGVGLAPDGSMCPTGAGGDLFGVAGGIGPGGMFVNWTLDPLVDGRLYDTFVDGDYSAVNVREAYYKGTCVRPATHSVFLAQSQLMRTSHNAPTSGCPTPHSKLARGDDGNPDLDRLNLLLTDVGCATFPDLTTAMAAEQAACVAIVQDQQRIDRDFKMGLFSPSFTLTQLSRQFESFQSLQCASQFGIHDLNPRTCAAACAGQACSNTCAGGCGTCATGVACSFDGKCEPACVPQCLGKQCGPDLCGGYCGTCPAGSACNAGGQCEPVTSTLVSFAQQIQPLLDQHCSYCHTAALDFDSTQGVSYGRLVNGRSLSCPERIFVIPGDSADSYLVDKMWGVLGLCAGSTMRYGATNAQLQLVSDWIDQGALDN